MLLYVKLFFFEVVAPLIVLAVYAAFLPSGIKRLVQAWKVGNKKLIWVYSWGLLVFIYFFIQMVKS